MKIFKEEIKYLKQHKDKAMQVSTLLSVSVLHFCLFYICQFCCQPYLCQP